MVDAPDRTLEWVVTLMAASLTTIGFVPQLIRSLRTRSTHDLSLTTFILCGVGVTVWVYVGLLYENWVMVAYDVVNLVLCVLVVRLKLKYG